MSKIIIQLSGGLVADVFIQGNGIPEKTIIVNEDVEGADPKEIVSVDVTKDVYEACIHTKRIARLKKGSDVDLIIKEYLKA